MTADRRMPHPSGMDSAEWVDEHGDALFRYAMTRVTTEDVAEELVQETLLAALRARDSFAGQSSVRTWLIGILRHKIVDHIRRVRRERPTDPATVTAATEAPFFDQRGIWKVTLAPWPIGDSSRTLEQQEFWDVFEKCMSRLPGSLADAFRLRALEDLRAAEVCQALDITPTNLWARLHRARLLLRECLERRWFSAKEKRT